MRNIFKFLSIIAGLLFFAACKKDEARTTLHQGTFLTAASSGLTASATTLVLDSANGGSGNAVTFNWPVVSFGEGILVSYTLQFDIPADSFKSPINVSVGVGATSKAYIANDFNKLVYQSLGMAAGTAGTLLVRAKADVNQYTGSSSSVPSSYSNMLTMTVTPYQIILVFPTLWVPGNYQGWNPPTAPTLASVKSNGSYEGYVNITGGTPLFKLTAAADWNHTNYGDGGNGTLSALSTASNLTVPAAGYYRILASTTALTWSATATTWAIIGDAPTASNNWGNDVPMTFNAATGVWAVTTACVAGNFKFRANGDWNNSMNNFGDNAPADGIPDYNGGNIPITAAGNYTITLDLSHSGNYLYTIKKN
jgi:starch-binding outer membrane protein SusE/F